MTERPILFTGPMVRALRDGSKTQTRRALYVLTKNARSACFDRRYSLPADLPPLDRCYTLSNWRHAEPGDRLWVRESWMPDPPCDGTWSYTEWAGCSIGKIAGVPERFRHPAFCNYAASWLHGPVKWTPSIHMPRWASRLTLEITGGRVERLQDISEADAKAEGCDPMHVDPTWSKKDLALIDLPLVEPEHPYRNGYAILWNAINGAGSWDLNPWVRVIEFAPPSPTLSLEKS